MARVQGSGNRCASEPVKCQLVLYLSLIANQSNQTKQFLPNLYSYLRIPLIKMTSYHAQVWLEMSRCMFFY